MTSAYAAESNRRNAKKSTGPRSPAGKERSRWNALEHGATSRLLFLPGEDREDLEKQRAAWLDSRTTDDPIELALVERAIEVWQQLGRTLRAQQGKVEQGMLEAELVERQRARDAALELGNRLFHDQNGPNQCYPNRSPVSKTPATSGGNIPGDRDQPARIILRLESTAVGCRWLLARWKELAEILEAGECWQSPDRFRAIRLLGKQPLDAVVDRDVRRIFLACHVISPGSNSPFDDLLHEVGDDPGRPDPVFRNALKQLAIKPYSPKSPAGARRVLTTMVDRVVTQLQVLLADHEAREEELIASAADRHAFDFDHDGELIRRYETSCDRAFHRALERLRVFRKDAQSPGCGTRKTEAETERSKAVILRMGPEKVTPQQSAVGSELSTVERTLAETDSGAMASPPPAPVGDDRGPGTSDGQKLRNEAVAASIDRAVLTGSAVPQEPTVLPPKPTERPRAPRQGIKNLDSHPTRLYPDMAV